MQQFSNVIGLSFWAVLCLKKTNVFIIVIIIIIIIIIISIYWCDSQWRMTIWTDPYFRFNSSIDMKSGEIWPGGLRREVV